eukprot:CAMPEP_0174878204 /NCGR_PEP_ID=MMETSP1114-20130205/82642_1 /TAXON_ID=312471 /ORGANISM="Neobodo designis, Strain CCAP 1951/1" /LENGTH=668 /DNA_ID=CAMNT_0016113591 /DNA_START=35 /DNA_END=2041 /DNA_ORIENTATION=+
MAVYLGAKNLQFEAEVRALFCRVADQWDAVAVDFQDFLADQGRAAVNSLVRSGADALSGRAKSLFEDLGARFSKSGGDEVLMLLRGTATMGLEGMLAQRVMLKVQIPNAAHLPDGADLTFVDVVSGDPVPDQPPLPPMIAPSDTKLAAISPYVKRNMGTAAPMIMRNRAWTELHDTCLILLVWLNNFGTSSVWKRKYNAVTTGALPTMTPCNACGRSAATTVVTCPRCEVAVYCSGKCRSTHEQHHSAKLCSILAPMRARDKQLCNKVAASPASLGRVSSTRTDLAAAAHAVWKARDEAPCLSWHDFRFRVAASGNMADLRAGPRGELTPLFSHLRLEPIHFIAIGATRRSGNDDGRGDYAAMIDATMRGGFFGAPVDINARDFLGCTPIHHAAGPHATEASLALLPVLVRHGADIDARNKVERTALEEAMAAGRLDAVRALVQAGAALLPVLVRHGADIDARNKVERTALEEAMVAGRLDAVRALVQAGADASAALAGPEPRSEEIAACLRACAAHGGPLRAGDRVVIDGLLKAPHLNGRTAVVQEKGHALGRYAVVPEGADAPVGVFVDKLVRRVSPSTEPEAPPAPPATSPQSNGAEHADSTPRSSPSQEADRDQHSADASSAVCAVCGATATKRCSACRQACYCGVACQKAHWKQHKRECGKHQ